MAIRENKIEIIKFKKKENNYILRFLASISIFKCGYFKTK
jgi:hypothetical protein